jgi:hypothetical protein
LWSYARLLPGYSDPPPRGCEPGYVVCDLAPGVSIIAFSPILSPSLSTYFSKKNRDEFSLSSNSWWIFLEFKNPRWKNPRRIFLELKKRDEFSLSSKKFEIIFLKFKKYEMDIPRVKKNLRWIFLKFKNLEMNFLEVKRNWDKFSSSSKKFWDEYSSSLKIRDEFSSSSKKIQDDFFLEFKKSELNFPRVQKIQVEFSSSLKILSWIFLNFKKYKMNFPRV